MKKKKKKKTLPVNVRLSAGPQPWQRFDSTPSISLLWPEVSL